MSCIQPILLDLFNTQQREILTSFGQTLQPKPKLTGADWTNLNFYLSPESSSLAGKMTLHPYQIDIVNAMTDEWTEMVVLEKSSRIGYNKLINCAIGYFIEQDPATILFYSPNDQLSKDIALTEIKPMLRDNPMVDARIKNPSGTSTSRAKLVDTNMLKSFAGGYLQMLGAMTPNNFAQRTARIIVVDELSRWLDNIGGEGDGVSLARVRASDFYNGKVIVGSSPTHTHRNKIGQLYNETDMRLRHMPCPHCHHRQPLEWENMKYNQTDSGIVIDNTVGFECQKCKKLIRQNAQRWMDKNGIWIKQKPQVQRHAGFKIWTAYGYSPKMTWVGIAKRYEDVKDNNLKLQSFTNTVLGRSWDDEGETLNPSAIMDKRETFDADYDLPMGALLLTAGVDTQNDRLEMMVVAHGENRERWIVDYHVILGDPSQQEVWDDLERYYDELRYSHPLATDGGLGIYAMSIDSGGGRTSYVYNFCKPRLHKRIYPIKGANTVDAKEVTKREAITKKNSKYKITHFQIGTVKIKDYIMIGLGSTEFGSNYIHIPDAKFVTDEWAEGLVSEYKDTESGKWLPKEEGTKRNEPLDTLVYAESAKLIANVNLDKIKIQQEQAIRRVQEIKNEEVLAKETPQVRGTMQLSGDAY